MSRFQRRHEAGGGAAGDTLELFYDLVFVFAITQVSHLLLDDLTWAGAGRRARAARRLVGVELHDLGDERARPRLDVVRLLLIGDHAREPADGRRDPGRVRRAGRCCSRAAYVAIQVGRHTFLTFAAADAGTIERERAGTDPDLVRRGRGALDRRRARRRRGAHRALDRRARDRLRRTARPVLGPGAAAARGDDVGRRDGAFRRALPAVHDHRARRVDRGHRRDDRRARRSTPRGSRAFGVAFLATAAMWWLYFDYVASVGSATARAASGRSHETRPGRLHIPARRARGGRFILTAVGDELVIAHPPMCCPRRRARSSSPARRSVLLGHVLFRLRMAGSVSGSASSARSRASPSRCSAHCCPALALAGLIIAVLNRDHLAEHLADARRRAAGELRDRPSARSNHAGSTTSTDERRIFHPEVFSAGCSRLHGGRRPPEATSRAAAYAGRGAQSARNPVAPAVQRLCRQPRPWAIEGELLLVTPCLWRREMSSCTPAESRRRRRDVERRDCA